MTADRDLDWHGCFNARDLGGLRAAGGRAIRRGAVVRSDAPDRLSAEGWAALEAYGIRTVIDLRNDDEVASDLVQRPGSVSTVHLPLDGIEDTEFWGYWASGPQYGTPLYFRPFLERFPERTARVLAHVANAPAGGVLVHCTRGRDRTGLVSLLLLAACGVPAEAIAADYALSAERVSARCAGLGELDDGPEIEAYLAREGHSAHDLVLGIARDLDVEAHLRAGGFAQRDLAALRARLLE